MLNYYPTRHAHVAKAYNAQITTPPVNEPVTAAEAKLHLRIDHSDEDDLIDRLIEVARQQCEDEARRAFITRTYTATLQCWPYGGVVQLPHPPLISVTSFDYTDDEGNTTTWASSNYIVDTQSQPGHIVIKDDVTLPSDSLQEVNPITITYTAGYGTETTDVPARYKQAMLLLLGHLYENREAVIAQPGVTAVEMPWTIKVLCWTDRGGW